MPVNYVRLGVLDNQLNLTYLPPLRPLANDARKGAVALNLAADVGNGVAGVQDVSYVGKAARCGIQVVIQHETDRDQGHRRGRGASDVKGQRVVELRSAQRSPIRDLMQLNTRSSSKSKSTNEVRLSRMPGSSPTDRLTPQPGRPTRCETLRGCFFWLLLFFIACYTSGVPVTYHDGGRNQ